MYIVLFLHYHIVFVYVILLRLGVYACPVYTVSICNMYITCACIMYMCKKVRCMYMYCTKMVHTLIYSHTYVCVV